MSAPEHELKYELPVEATGLFRQWLGAVLRPDPKYPAALVHSLYYDAPDWRLLGDKVDSDFIKLKVRARSYATLEGQALPEAFAEVKRKEGARRRKDRLFLPDVTGQRLSAARPAEPWLLDLPRRLVEAGHLELGPWQPAFLIVYERWRFVDSASGSRVALDSAIRVPASNPRMMPYQNPAPLAWAVLEVKGQHGALPPRLLPILQMGARKAAFSKYLRCHTHLTGLVPVAN